MAEIIIPDEFQAIKTRLENIIKKVIGENTDSSLSSSSTNPVQNATITSELNGKSDVGHSHTLSDLTDLTIQQETITVTSPTSGSNYFNGGTREIKAVKYGRIVQVWVNFYDVSAKQSSSSTDTVIGTLPDGWHPKISTKVKCATNNNSNIYASFLSFNESGTIALRIANTTALTSVTFRGTVTFITA